LSCSPCVTSFRCLSDPVGAGRAFRVPSAATLADMAHVLEESHWTTRRGRLLRGPDRNVPPLVRPGNAGPRSSTHRAHCGYGPSNGSLDRSTAARGISVGRGPSILDPGPRSCFRRTRANRRGDGHLRSAHSPAGTLAERHCGTVYRLNPSRVSGSRPRVPRGGIETTSRAILRLPPTIAHPPVARQRHANLSSGQRVRRGQHRRDPTGWRLAPPIRTSRSLNNISDDQHVHYLRARPYPCLVLTKRTAKEPAHHPIVATLRRIRLRTVVKHAAVCRHSQSAHAGDHQIDFLAGTA
jgi:hypothetical protein